MRRLISGKLATKTHFRPSSKTAAALLLGGTLWGCSSGGYVPTADLRGPSRDAATLQDAGLPGDAGGNRDGSPGDMTLMQNNWTFYDQIFQSSTASCLTVMTWWAITVNASAPYFCSLDVFFSQRPTHDAVYSASGAPANSLPAGQATIVITDERTGGVEQWDGIASGQVAVHVDGSKLTVTLQNMVARGAVSVPVGTPDQPVSGTLVCP